MNDKNNKIEWIEFNKFKSFEEYFKCYIFLTTVSMANIKYKGKILSGLSNAPVKFEFYIPLKYLIDSGEINKYNDDFWKNYTWICRTMIDYYDKDKIITANHQAAETYYHYKMLSIDEQIYPPIPKFLIELYNQSSIVP